MNMHVTLTSLMVLAACALLAAGVSAQRAKDGGASASTGGAGDASPIFGVTVPAGHRLWELVAVSYETAFDEFRGILGNPLAIKACGAGTLPFPDGAMLAKVAWKHVPSAEDNRALGQIQAFVPGPATTVQIMIKDSKKYAGTGGWGFGRFIDGKPVDEAQHETCFPCHQAYAKAHDLVFTRYAR